MLDQSSEHILENALCKEHSSMVSQLFIIK